MKRDRIERMRGWIEVHERRMSREYGVLETSEMRGERI
jgi:hypothetical protein